MDGGGYHDNMTQMTRMKHEHLMTSRKCPACQAQVEKHDGSLWLVWEREGGRV